MAPRTRSKGLPADEENETQLVDKATSPDNGTTSSTSKRPTSPKSKQNPKRKPKPSEDEAEPTRMSRPVKPKPKGGAKAKSAPRARVHLVRDTSPTTSEDNYSSSDERTFHRPFRGRTPPPLPGYRTCVRMFNEDGHCKYEILGYDDFHKEFRPKLKYYCVPYANV